MSSLNEDDHQRYDRISAAGAALLFTFFPAINWLQAFQANRPAVLSENLSVKNQYISENKLIQKQHQNLILGLDFTKRLQN